PRAGREPRGRKAARQGADHRQVRGAAAALALAAVLPFATALAEGSANLLQLHVRRGEERATALSAVLGEAPALVAFPASYRPRRRLTTRPTAHRRGRRPPRPRTPRGASQPGRPVRRRVTRNCGPTPPTRPPAATGRSDRPSAAGRSRPSTSHAGGPGTSRG